MSAEEHVEEERLLAGARPTLSESLQVEASTGQSGYGAARRALLCSHFLSTWGQRGFEFAVGLIMLELHPASLIFVALWGLLDGVVSVLCGAAVGAWVDRQPRLVAATRMYLLQNASVALSAATALALLWSRERSGGLYWAGLVLTMEAGSISTLGALGSTLAGKPGREWTKTLCGSDSAALARLNSAMKRVDLTCLIASPILVGLVMQTAGGPPMVAATLVMLAWNLCAWLPEVLLLQYAQRCSPALAAAKPAQPASGAAAAADADAPGKPGSAAGSSSAWQRLVAGPLQQQARAWGLYARQPAAAAAAALALLYLTVLSFGTLMTAYLAALGLPEAELAVYRGLGALSGIAATVAFPPLHRRLGLVALGGLSIWLQLGCLLGGVAPEAAAALGAGVSARARMYALVWGLVLSRFGLWSFDLAVNQLIQEAAEHSALATVMGVQGSLQSLCQMLAYLGGVLVPATGSFVWLMAGSCGAVGTAAALYTAFALRSGCGRGMERQPAPLPA